jgi:hypothetical protein
MTSCRCILASTSTGELQADRVEHALPLGRQHQVDVTQRRLDARDGEHLRLRHGAAEPAGHLLGHGLAEHVQAIELLVGGEH